MKSKTVLVFFLVLGVVFAGCIGGKTNSVSEKSVDKPASTAASEALAADIISDNDAAALEAELSEIEDFLREIESVDIDISELDEASFD
ncbi:MAG TPA: hypothetical protein ENH13_01805 [Euryarchaeota archaeon]|nr:hypothetical protein BMS3Abin16_01620 [archaeon BMS3Abin16]GBE55906.1 hypothetical protein BMS3Bbin16_00101 [archaeon BMS3Bbin16]HDH27849.1 hypothetical protein [Euryarchaeota archaeon]HDY74082.1 hypothetical protein [Euryarchaeota archaeon]